MAKRVTIADVARAAGVSKGTVSRTLAGTYPVSELTAKAVAEAVDELGYVASVRARALATGKANAIAVVLSEPFDALFSDPTFALIMKGVFDAMSTTEYTPLLLQVQSEAEQKKALHLLSNQAVDAVIHLSPWKDEGLLDSLLVQDLPVVLCGQTRNDAYMRKFSAIYADDILGGETAAKHLRSRGVHNPIVITGDADQPAAQDRVAGYKTVFESVLTDDRIVYCGWSEQDGVQAIHRFLKNGTPFDGVLAGSDRIARGAVTVLAAQGISVPDQVRVIGFDDHDIATQYSPQLTTIAQPMHKQGALAFAIAIEMVDGKQARIEILPTELKIRQTT